MAFDYTVHRKNGRGEVVSENPYRLSIEQGVARLERPVGSGIWYSPGGELLPESLVKMKDVKEEAERKEKEKELQAAQKLAAEQKLVEDAAQVPSLKGENAKLLAKIAELEKRVK